MNDAALTSLALGVPGVHVRTLVTLRWFLILAQLITLLFVHFILGQTLPFAACMAMIAASVILNLGLVTIYARNVRLEGMEALLHFVFDLVQMGGLLFLTGGLTNPFVLFLAVPTTIAAALLSAQAALGMLCVTVGVLFFLWRLALPLPWSSGEDLRLPDAYHALTFIALSLCLTFLVLYATRIARENRQRAQALAATQAALETEGRMSALGSLAAAAAHELGGPLGTITLIAKDLSNALGNDPDFSADLTLLNEEAKRARHILASIARRNEASHPFPHVGLLELMTEIIGNFDSARVPLRLHVDPGVRSAPPVVIRSPELLHGVSNFIANAIRHAQSEVRISLYQNDAGLSIIVEDDGPGFPPEILPHLGEPFLGSVRKNIKGLGLGIFIATTLLERLGARLTFDNLLMGGAHVSICWPGRKLESNDLLSLAGEQNVS